MDDDKFLILGANGQLGKALHAKYSGARTADVDELDITDEQAVRGYNWSGIEVILNAAAYTNVDGAETPEGRATANKVNDQAVGYLANIASQQDLLLVHIGTDYDFDGQKNGAYTEEDSPSPLGAYAKSKVAGCKRVAKVPKHYIIRTSWVIGDGKNFVRTMLGLGAKGVAPTVVADQIGRPTFTPTLVEAIDFLITKQAAYGTYNVSNEGPTVSWADFTRAIFEAAGYDLKVANTTTEKYFADKPESAPRPLNSLLDLSKIEELGFKPGDWRQDLKQYIKKELSR